MSAAGASVVERWTPESRIAIAAAAVILAALAIGPAIFSANAVDKLTTLFIYVILALMWNALVGFCGLVSIGQQAFFGLGAYAAIRLADLGVSVYPSLFIGALIVGALSWPLSLLMLRLKGGEFAIGMWVVSELAHLLVNLDTLVRGETGTSLIELNAYSTGSRRALTYWCALIAMAGLLAIVFSLLRSPLGAAIQAIRDNEEAAESIGVRVARAKRLVFTLAAFGAALAGALWVATALTFQPKAYFSPLWTAYMIFMALVGGLGTFEGAILGAVVFFAIETWFGDMGVWYLVGLGATALVFALLFPRGFWGWVEDSTSLRLLPIGYRLRLTKETGGAKANELGAETRRGRRWGRGLMMLLGKTIVITGISSGIGARIGELALALGADIIGIDVNPPARPLDAFIKADIGSAQGVAEIVETLPGGFDALCNVAGVSGMIGAAKTLAINFYGLRELTQALAPRLRQGGAVVNVASIAGYGWRANLERAKAFSAAPGFPDLGPLLAAHQVPDGEAYPLSKELLLLWTMRAAHQPLFKDRGLRVNAVSPGPVTTPILKEFRQIFGDPRVDDDIARVGRAGSAPDIAPAALFLCSDGARWINGANLPVDGGLEASINATVLGF